jgi:uncharacterized membrane protein YjgN (DUF898 family)
MDERVMTGAAPAPAAGLTVRPRFTGDGGRFVRLLFVGGLLQIITIGFYRFWLLTNVRRHLWSATSVDGDAFEYTGRGRELLIGFLFAIAILAPVFLVYFLIGIEAERYKAFASLPLYLILFFFMQFAIYRARRYRLTRTIWRGVRFWMTGSGWAYALRSFLWMLLVIVTFGLAYPWRAAALERYKMRHTFYGDLQGQFVGTGWGLFKPAIVLWLVLLAVLGVMIAVSAVLLPSTLDHLRPADVTAPLKGPAMDFLTAVLGALGGVFFILLAILWPIYQAIEWRWWASGLRFGEVTFESAFPRMKVLTLYLRYIAYVLLAGILIGIVIFAAAMGLRGVLSPEFLDSAKYVLIGLAVLGYLLILLGLGVAYRYFLQHQLWRAIVDSLTIRNLEAAAGVVARGKKINALGEGLLDGLDIAGF